MASRAYPPNRDQQIIEILREHGEVLSRHKKLFTEVFGRLDTIDGRLAA